MPEKRDSSFSWSDFGKRVNNILVGNYSNFIHRSLSIAKEADIELIAQAPVEADVGAILSETFDKTRLYLESAEYKNYLDTILNLSAFGNKYFDENQIWRLKKEEPALFQIKLKQLYLIIVSLGYLTQPLLCEGSQKIFANLGLTIKDIWPSPNNEVSSIEKLIPLINTKLTPTPIYLKLPESTLGLP
jgi:methionyl-tRNA synthetase